MAVMQVWLGFYFLLLFLPMTIDGFGQLKKRWESTNIRRLLTGIMGGVGIIYIFYTGGALAYSWGQEIGRQLLEQQV